MIWLVCTEVLYSDTAGIAVSSGRDDPRFISHSTDFVGKHIYNPLLVKVFSKAWKYTSQKRSKEQPISVAVITHLVAVVITHEGGDILLSVSFRDASILDTFTGSRVAEYTQL